MAIRSPPVRPPAVLISTACGGWPGATLGKRIFAAPDWNRRSSRVAPSSRLKRMREAPCVRCGRVGNDVVSNGEMTANVTVVEIRGRARKDDLATIHDRHLVRKLAGEIEILLHEHDSQTGLLL